MSNDREHSSSTPTTAASAHRIDPDPGRGSHSALMRKPDHALASGLVQRKARDANGVAEGADTAVAAAGSSSGSPLPENLQRKFESSLGADLSGVRVHTGESSAAANDAVGAKAYTMGNDIHFGAGNYDPSSKGGEHLLAHEVAHTVQQSGGPQRRQFKLSVSSPGDSLEHEADAAADAMVSGTMARVANSDMAIARKPEQALSTPNEKVDLKKVDAQIAYTNVVQERVADTASGWGEKIVEMIEMLNGTEGALAVYDEMAEVYAQAREEFLAAIEKQDEEENSANELATSVLETVFAAAMTLATGPGGLALAEVFKLKAVGELVLDKALELPVTAFAALGKPAPSNQASTAKYVIQTKELKQLSQTREILHLTAEIGKRAGTLAQLARLGPLFSKTVENLTALRNKGGTQAGTIMSPSDCETTVRGFAGIYADCTKIDGINGSMYSRVKEIVATANKQRTLTTKESALRHLWSQWRQSGATDDLSDPGCFGAEEIYPDGASGGHHKEMTAYLQIGRTAVATATVGSNGKGTVLVANQSFQARAYGKEAIPAGATCHVLGVVEKTATLIVDAVEAEGAKCE